MTDLVVPVAQQLLDVDLASFDGEQRKTESEANEETSELKITIEKACWEQGLRLRSQLSPQASFWFTKEPHPHPGWIAQLRQMKMKTTIQLGNLKATGGGISRSTPELTTSEQPVTNQPSFKERLKKATELDIRPENFSWKNLLSVCRTEHMQEDAVEDDTGALGFSVNSGGMVFFSLFNCEGAEVGEAAACIKFAPSRLATQSEVLGLELARHLGVLTPQARVIHCGTNEWSVINFTVEDVKKKANIDGDEVVESTCGELLEALSISRCLLLMGYIDGGSLLSTPQAFTEKTAEMTAETLGRVMLLDLVLRNEDRLECQQLGWRGNSANLLATERPPLGQLPAKNRTSKSLIPRSRGRLEKRSSNVNLLKPSRSHSEQMTSVRGTTTRVSSRKDSLPRSELLPRNQSKSSSGKLNNGGLQSSDTEKPTENTLYIVAIDSGVPRRPPSMKAEKDKADYPKFVELLLNDEIIALEVLKEISVNKFECLNNQVVDEAGERKVENSAQKKIVKAFQEGFRAGAHDMQDLRMFLLTLFRRLNHLLREVVEYMANYVEEEDGILVSGVSSNPPSHQNSVDHGRRSIGSTTFSSATELRSKLEKLNLDSGNEDSATEDSATEERDCAKGLPKGKSHLTRGTHSPSRSDSPSSGRSSVKSSPRMSREGWHEKKQANAPTNPSQLGMRLTLKLKDVDKYAKFDGELNKQLDDWNDNFRTQCKTICEEQHFTSGFSDRSTNHSLVDSYELKVRLDHLLERMALIVQGIQTERPSCVLKHLYIGGVVSARSFHTLQRLGITHVLCLCPNEFSIEADYPDLYEFKSFQIKDDEHEDITRFFEDACTFIDSVEKAEGIVLVHCFEGKSRSAGVVLAYLMKRKCRTLLQAWALLKAIHPRSQPNDGFMKSLVQLDLKLHGKVSMDWKQRKPEVRMCPICGRSAGISSVSLRSHLQRFHPGVKHVLLTSVPSPEAEEIKTATSEIESNATLKLENVLSVLEVDR